MVQYKGSIFFFFFFYDIVAAAAFEKNTWQTGRAAQYPIIARIGLLLGADRMADGIATTKKEGYSPSGLVGLAITCLFQAIDFAGLGDLTDNDTLIGDFARELAFSNDFNDTFAD